MTRSGKRLQCVLNSGSSRLRAEGTPPCMGPRWPETQSVWTAGHAEPEGWFLSMKGNDKAKTNKPTKNVVARLLSADCDLKKFEKIETDILCRWGLCQSNTNQQPKSAKKKENDIKIIRESGVATKSSQWPNSPFLASGVTLIQKSSVRIVLSDIYLFCLFLIYYYF